MLGWRILNTGEYKLPLPRISKEEEAAIVSVAERFKETTRVESIESKEHAKEMLKKLLLAHSKNNNIYLDKGQTEYLSKIAYLHIYGFGFVELLLNDRDIEEISIIGIERPAYVYLKDNGWKSVNACFTKEKTIADIVNKMARSIGRHITIQNPRLDAMLPDGSRLHASLTPISQGEITIRKFRRNPFSAKELYTTNTLSLDALVYLSLIMQGDQSVIIAGNTASGKTTTMNTLFSFVPANERVIITEETPEINIPHKHQLRLIANKDMKVSLKELVYDSLRMRPDRMIVGEIRNAEEAEAMFDVLLAGQARGSYATMHAQSAEEAIQRLLSFGINRMDINSIDCIIVQRRMLKYDIKKRQNTEVRRVVNISEINDEVKSIFSYNREKDKLEQCAESNLLARVAQNFGISEKAFEKEIKKRKTLFSSVEPDNFYRKIQRELYKIKEG